MKLALINTVDYGSTGKIMIGISSICHDAKIDCYSFSLKTGSKPKITGHFYFGSMARHRYSFAKSLFLGNDGFNSYFETKDLLRKIDFIEPDIIHLHNLHGSYLNVPLLFDYCKKKRIKIVWTLHDCWSFTGRCPHFQITACDKWKTGCSKCKYPSHSYPQSLFDHTKAMWKKKKKYFTSVDDLTIVTPSTWLANLVKESYLGKYHVEVINNGINLTTFKPQEPVLRSKFPGKKIILAVSSVWNYSKGFDVIVEVAKMFPDDYQMVVVGTNEENDKYLPANVFSIHRTENPKELVEIYSSCDVFVNPTLEDTFPTVNMEALACGAPVISFNTGGCPEIADNSCGIILEEKSATALKNAIDELLKKDDLREKCLKRAQLFNERDKYREYLELYRKIIMGTKWK